MNIVTDPFLTVVPSADAEALAGTDKERFEAICSEVEQMDDVREAREKHTSATELLAKLKAATVQMNKRGKELFDRIAEARERFVTNLIAHYANGGDPVQAAELFNSMTVAEGERGALMCALVRLQEHVAPLAAIDQYDSEERLFSVRAKRFQEIAEERMKRTSELMRDVAEFEGEVTIDVRTGLTGFIFTYVEMLKSQASDAFKEARGQEEAYMRANQAKQ